jgi:lipopolysaccharide/colanic/teichoic acid biosynthesis glycosyltransferase
MVAVALAIKLDSPGPVFFTQTRVGRGHKPIRVVKFRTMRPQAERLGPAITATADPRITRIGEILRKTKLDELPQLWNVLRGEMAIVGPRPEVPRYVDHYRPAWKRLVDERPGLTDLGSIVFRDEERLLAEARDRERAYMEIVMPMKLALALQGLEAKSLRNDLAVIARTAAAIVRGHDPASATFVEEARRQIEQLNRSTMEDS